MKSCCLFLCAFFLSSFSFSQNFPNDVFFLGKIPSEGILLDTGWKFHTGDDISWAKPDFNDVDWQPINPALDIRHIPELQQTSHYWFRLKLQIDSTLADQPLGITLSQVGASEIYLDGKLIYKLGSVDSTTKQISTHYLLNQPFVINLKSRLPQILAIRYSFDPKSFLVKLGQANSCFKAVLNTSLVTLSNHQTDYRRSGIYETGIMSVSLLLAVVSFCFYFLYPSQKAYKYIGIVGGLMFSWRFIGYSISSMLSQTNLVSLAVFVSTLLIMLSALIGLNGMYLLFNQQKTRLYYILIFFGVFVAAAFLFLYDWAGLLYTIFYTLNYIELWRISVKAARNKRPGNIILMCTILILIISQLVGVVSLAYNSLSTAYFVMFLQPVTIALGWAAFIAYEFARTGLALQARVKEVSELSEEKHRILSEQNILLEKQVEQRTSQLQNSLTVLQQTQSQLIQSEKMASLGVLTAGIAHEIQNPLNFVNNFSEVNRELIDEMREQLATGNGQQAIEIAKNIRENEEKINLHGQRADAIVKGMLQHSRTSSGQKESTDINTLADEYLRLAYHGLRAKDKSLNARVETAFDTSIGKINIIPQDIGRVLLNVINNAFYAVNEKQKQNLDGYQPLVTIKTLKENGRIGIRVKDNGIGIPQKNLGKIFQPFFTTKPTGQGTGLGLSLAYDIVTKGHGGELKVETLEGQGSEFIIELPTQ